MAYRMRVRDLRTGDRFRESVSGLRFQVVAPAAADELLLAEATEQGEVIIRGPRGLHVVSLGLGTRLCLHPEDDVELA